MRHANWPGSAGQQQEDRGLEKSGRKVGVEVEQRTLNTPRLGQGKRVGQERAEGSVHATHERQKEGEWRGARGQGDLGARASSRGELSDGGVG